MLGPSLSIRVLPHAGHSFEFSTTVFASEVFVVWFFFFGPDRFCSERLLREFACEFLPVFGALTK